MKKLTILATVFLLASCSSSGFVKMEVFETNLAVDMKCVKGTEMVTLLKASDGRVTKQCGYWGKEGTRVRVRYNEPMKGWATYRSGFQLN